MYRKFVTVIFGVYGIHCGMLFRVIHVQSLIRDILHVEREWERAKASEKERERMRKRGENYRIYRYIKIYKCSVGVTEF